MVPLQKSIRMNTSQTSPPPTAVMLESKNPTMFLWPLRSRCNKIHTGQSKVYKWLNQWRKKLNYVSSESQNRSHLSITQHSAGILLTPALAPCSACAHHDLDLALADLQVVLVVDVHPLQGTSHPLIGPHQKYDGEAACGHKQTNYV